MEVRFLDVRTVPEQQLAVWESWLSLKKRQRIDRLSPRHRLASLCADGLAREMLAEMLHCAPEEVVFTYTATGKPLVEGGHFSVSHSGSVVACAVSDVPIGIDVERIRPVPPRLGRALGEWQSEADFWQLWTRREAALKCRGETLGAWKRSGEEKLTFSPLTAPEGYVAAVCEEK